MTWSVLEGADPKLAAFAAQRLAGKVAYLATVRKDGGPRVHPVTPIIGEGHLFLFMEPTSPKGYDLRRDGRYALHSAVNDTGGSNGECIITGKALLIEDSEVRAVAVRVSSYTPADRYILFELSVETVVSTVYGENGTTHMRWNAGG